MRKKTKRRRKKPLKKRKAKRSPILLEIFIVFLVLTLTGSGLYLGWEAEKKSVQKKEKRKKRRPANRF